MSKVSSKLLSTGLTLLTVAACGDASSALDPDEGQTESLTGRSESSLTPSRPGGHLPGISDEDFAIALEAFNAVEDVDDGLGPIFNEQGCGVCHSQGAVGGAGTQIERRFGRFDRRSSRRRRDSGELFFNPLTEAGGSLRQLFTLGSFTNAAGQSCTVELEREPRDATVRNVGRLTTPLFGLGLVDAMPDSFFVDLANSQPRETRGRANFVTIDLPNPSDPSQRLGGQRVGRFGWKAGVPNLVQFAADAYLNEMGITTQHCIGGRSVETFATESAPNGRPVAPGCDDNLPGVDDAVGSCANGLTEIQDDVGEFAEFMAFLAPPPRGLSTSGSRSGERTFNSVGCANCHTPRTFTTPKTTPNGVPGGFAFQPYSDFLVHDMGELGDHIGNAGDSVARTREMRTAPLWGLRFRTLLLHDGRTTDVRAAILAHDGQAERARDNFAKLSSDAQRQLVDFLLTL